MKKLIVSCPGCKAKYDVGKFEPGTKFKCKTCGKSLIVPDGGGGNAEAEEPQAAKPAKAGSHRAAAGARGARGRREEYDDDMEERPFPRTKKGPNWPLIGGLGGALVLFAIIAVVILNKESAKAADEAAKRKAAQTGDLREHIPDPAVDPAAQNQSDPAKTEKKPPKEKDTGEFKKETYDQDDKRTIDSTADRKTQVDRLMMRKKIFEVDSSVKSSAEDMLGKFKENFNDPPVAQEFLDKFAALGKKAFPAGLNFITNMNHKNEQDAMAASQLFETIEKMAAEFWKYENEYKYGMFEDGEEKWKAIVEMKELWSKHSKE